jgi:hypothetical protein
MAASFKKYQHIERLGTTEVQNIELGECYVFPKVDGTNASVWFCNGEIQAGSRTRHLSTESDNAGFYAWASQNDALKSYFQEYPTHRLFGEWLVPHSLKTYRQDAWRRFYVFDVCVDKEPCEILHEGDSELKYLHYLEYKPLLEGHGIDYCPPISIVRNGVYEQFINQLAKNVFLIEDGKGAGEGIVIKNYDFKNKYNRQAWAKIVTSEFKEQHAKVMGASEVNGRKLIEEEIAAKFVTSALVDKEFAKIESVDGWTSKMIPRLLNTVYYSVVKEEAWEFVKEHKNPTIDFKRLQHFVFNEVKQKKPMLF